MRCFVTGATGFIGRRVVALLRERGHDVRVLARDPDKAIELLKLPFDQIVAGDLFSTPRIKSIAQDADVVLHLAAETALQRDPKKLWRVDVDGTDALADACEGARLQRFVFASTVVVGDPRGALLKPEEPLLATTEYGKAKQEAERRLARARLPLVVVRPCHVYGAGGWFEELVNDFRRGRRFMPGGGANLWDVVHVDDVAAALVLCAEAAPAGSVYHAADDHPITMREFFERTAHELNAGKPIPVPAVLAKLLRGSGPIAAATRSARTDNARLKELGWRPRFPDSRDGIPAAVRALAGSPARV